MGFFGGHYWTIRDLLMYAEKNLTLKIAIESCAKAADMIIDRKFF